MKGLSIGSKVLILVVGIVLAICIILGGINYRSSSKSLIDALNLTLVELASTGSKTLTAEIKVVEKQLETIAGRHVMRSWEWEQQKAAMIDEIEDTQFIGMAVIDRSGNAQYPDGKQLNLNDRQYFKDALNGKTVISDAIVSRVTNEVVFVVATPLRNKENQIQGVLIGRLPGTFLTGITNSLSYGEMGYSFVVDSKGTVIGHKNKDLILNQTNFIEEAKKDPSYKELAGVIMQMIQGKVGTGNYPYEGDIRYMGFSPIEGTTWAIAMGSYASEALAPVHQMLITIIVTALVLGVIFTLIGIFLGRSIGTQIRNVNTQIQGVIDSVIRGQLNERLDAMTVGVDFKNSVNGINDLIEAFYKPILVILENMDDIAKGEIPQEITETYHGDFNKMKNSVNNLIRIINGLLGETNKLINAATNGNLKERGNVQNFQNSWKDMIQGINNLVEAFVKPINTTTDLIQRISVGDMPPLIKEEYKGDFNTIKESVNLCINNINGLLGETNTLIKAIENGKLDVRGKADKFENSWKDLVGGINDLIVAFVKPINLTSDYIQRISDGDIPPLIKDKYEGDFNVIISNLNQLITIMNNLLKETGTLIQSAADGRLSVRGEEKKFKNSWRELIGGINKLMTAIVDPIQESMNVMRELANKNMTARVKGNYKGDLNEFKQNINNAGDNLEDALIQVDRAVQQISSASGEISNGSQSLASGSSEQASSLEEIASSLEEMNSLTLNNADNAKQGMTLSEQSLKHVMTGNSAMTRMNSAMDTITKSAKETSNIIKTINDIAFQTNLLALNAAVEAAHAGEAGKGFAVVAEEVKNLALRSAEAAKNTDELIESSLKNSEDGAKIVEEVTKSFEDIQTSFTKVNNIVKEISVSSDEQSEGIKQINTAVGELNKVTQANAANAEESASAAEELNSQSSELRSMVQEFRLTNSTGIGGSKRFDDRPQQLPGQGMKKSLPKPSGSGMSNKYGNQDIEIILPMDDDSEQDF